MQEYIVQMVAEEPKCNVYHSGMIVVDSVYDERNDFSFWRTMRRGGLKRQTDQILHGSYRFAGRVSLAYDEAYLTMVCKLASLITTNSNRERLFFTNVRL